MLRGKLPWIIGLVVIGFVALAGSAIWFSRDSDDSATVEGESQPAASSPVGESIPAPATPAVQAAAIAQLEHFWTLERVVSALDNPASWPKGETKGEPESVPSVPSGSSPEAPEGAEAEPTEPVVADTTPKSAVGVQRSCTQPAPARAAAGLPYKRSCYRGRLNRYPARTSGKLIGWDDSNYNGQDDDGEEYSCTATVGTSRNESVLLTAGHCVVTPASETRNGKARWAKSIAFIPSYVVQDFYTALEHGDTALARFAKRNVWWSLPIRGTDYQSLWSPTPWVTSRYFSHDFGAVVIAPRISGGSHQTIQDVLGSQGWDMTGTVSPGSVRLLGFPADDPFDGKVLFECRGSSHLVQYDDDPGPELRVGCDMTGGSSGGPWLVGVGTDGLGKVISVNSNGPRNVMYGPRFSPLHLDAMTKAQNTKVGA